MDPATNDAEEFCKSNMIRNDESTSINILKVRRWVFLNNHLEREEKYPIIDNKLYNLSALLWIFNDWYSCILTGIYCGYISFMPSTSAVRFAAMINNS